MLYYILSHNFIVLYYYKYINLYKFILLIKNVKYQCTVYSVSTWKLKTKICGTFEDKYIF